MDESNFQPTENHDEQNPVPRRTGVLENEIAPPPKRSRIGIGIAFLGAIMITAGLWRQFSGPRDLFSNNFALPESLMADFEARSATGTVEDSTGTSTNLPLNCVEYLKKADVFFKKGDFDSTQDVLTGMVEDEDSMSSCASTAYFYIGMLRLKLNDPNVAVKCFAKIEDFDWYGEDVQWLMALAFVRRAENDPDNKKQAVRALERIVNSGQCDERKTRALQMLQKLN